MQWGDRCLSVFRHCYGREFDKGYWNAKKHSSSRMINIKDLARNRWQLSLCKCFISNIFIYINMCFELRHEGECYTKLFKNHHCLRYCSEKELIVIGKWNKIELAKPGYRLEQMCLNAKLSHMVYTSFAYVHDHNVK